jgi:exodeoxyribonuclease VII large subunit
MQNPPAGVQILSVSQISEALKEVIEESFPAVWLAGELASCKKASSGHIYLTLKDAKAQIKAVVWRGVALRLRFDLKEGMELIVRGRISLYPPWGEYRVDIEELQPKGVGALELALRQLKEKLLTLGYFDPKRKKPLPRFPRRIALVTSPTGAAIRDMLEILGRRWPALEVWVCPVRVQGEEAPPQIASAIALLNRLHLRTPVDAMIVGRGGGSAQDLWEFNDERIARAIFDSRIPVVSAVGHEIDVTIADLVADRRALTPSEAAELVAPNREEVADLLQTFSKRMQTSLLNRLDTHRTRLTDLAGRRVFRLPLERVRDGERRLDETFERLQRTLRQRLESSHHKVQALSGQLESLSPLNVLRRGYSLTRIDPTGDVVRSTGQVHPGDRLVTQLASGRIFSRVELTDAPVKN